MQAIPWSPPGIDPALAAVMVPPGEVTERQWWEALADRVTSLVMQEPDPEAAMQQAATSLETVQPDYPAQAGQVLVQRNLPLRTAMSMVVLAVDDPFPAQAKADPQAQAAVQETDLTMWVALATSMVSTSSLD